MGENPETTAEGVGKPYNKYAGGIIMKVVSILGSPNKKGNTAKVLDCIADELRNNGHIVKLIVLNDLDVRGCQACFACKQFPDEPACVQNDDAGEIFEKMIDADAVILSTPLYCWGFSSQLKALIDRSICLVTGYGAPNFKSLVAGKKFALVATSGGPLENNLDILKTPWKHEMKFLGAVNAGEFMVPGCVNTGVDENITSDIVEDAKIFARELAK